MCHDLFPYLKPQSFICQFKYRNHTWLYITNICKAIGISVLLIDFY